MNRRHQFLTAAVLGAAVLALPACSGADGPADRQVATAHSESNDSAAGAVAPLSEQARTEAGTASDASLPGAPEEQVPSQPAVVSTAAISLSSPDVAATRQGVQRVLDTYRGQVVEEEGESSDSGSSYLRLVARVPSARFEETVQALSKVATVTQSSRTSDDVSTEVIDTAVRVRAQEASLRRVEALLGRAESLKDIVWIESQLTRRQADLDSLKQRQAWLADQTTRATVTLDITRATDGKPGDSDQPNGFVAGLQEGWRSLGEAASGTARVVGLLLPFAIPGVALGWIGFLLGRRLLGRRSPGPVVETRPSP